MQWTDTGIVISGRLFGEHGLIVDLLTRSHGRRAGLVHGGASRTRRSTFEPGNTIQVMWEARQVDALGRFSTAEAVFERAAAVLEMPTRLAAISSMTSLLRETIREDDPQPGLFEATEGVLDSIVSDDLWPILYVRWEIGLLSALGYGLDLDRCAISGSNDGLTHVSPKTGRAVRGSDAEEYVDRLLRLPPFLSGGRSFPLPSEIGDGLVLAGYFLERRILHAVHTDIPEARKRLIERLLADKVIVLDS